MIYFTTISKNYVPDWGVAAGVREIMQNALDSHDKGNKMGVTYVRSKKQLIIYNRGAKLTREALLLGSTSKLNDSTQRGQYGEGMKIGSLALVRAGKPVSIQNDEEKWEAVIKLSEEFDAEVLAFKVVKTKVHTDKLTFTVDNVEPKEWNEIRQKFLRIDQPDAKTVMKSPQGNVLLDKKYKGMIFCGGIYVDTHKDLEYGYDFSVSSLTLNRDRNMASSFEVTWATSQMWAMLAQASKGKNFDTHDMLKRGVPDVEYLKSFADYTVVGKTVAKFFEENPPKSYPVRNEEEATRVRGLGYNPVYSSASYAGVLSSNLGTIEELERRVEAEYSLFQEITPVDDANIQWCFELMFVIDPKFKFKMEVAKFEADTTRSVSSGKDIIINCNLIKSKYDVLHEVINHYSVLNKVVATQIWKKIYRNSLEGISND